MPAPTPTPYEWLYVKEYVSEDDTPDDVPVESEYDTEIGKISYYIKWAELRHIVTGELKVRKLASELITRKKDFEPMNYGGSHIR